MTSPSDAWFRTTEAQADAIRKKLKKLAAQQARTDLEIRENKEGLAALELWLKKRPRKLGQKGSRGASQSATAIEASAAENGARSHGPAKTGLRDAIRAALDGSTGLRPRSVLEHMKGVTKFQFQGKADPGLKVSTEMWRMWKNGLLRKSRSGLYSLPREGDETAEGGA